MFMGPRNWFQGMNFASLCSLAGRYDDPIPPQFLAPIDFLKIPERVFLNLYGGQESMPICQGINSASLCSLAGRYDNPIPTRCLAPIDFLKIPALLRSRIPLPTPLLRLAGYRENWIIYRRPGCLAAVWFGSLPTPCSLLYIYIYIYLLTARGPRIFYNFLRLWRLKNIRLHMTEAGKNTTSCSSTAAVSCDDLSGSPNATSRHGLGRGSQVWTIAVLRAGCSLHAWSRSPAAGQSSAA